VKNISNALTIGTDISAEHPELRSVAQAQGWWSGEGEFCFNEVFKSETPPARMELAKKRYSGGTQLLQQHDGEGDYSLYSNLIQHFQLLITVKTPKMMLKQNINNTIQVWFGCRIAYTAIFITHNKGLVSPLTIESTLHVTSYVISCLLPFHVLPFPLRSAFP
jgi:hypothetical protein